MIRSVLLFFVCFFATVSFVHGQTAANYIPKLGLKGELSNSIIYQDINKIGINTATPAALLDITGAGTTTILRLTTQPKHVQAIMLRSELVVSSTNMGNVITNFNDSQNTEDGLLLSSGPRGSSIADPTLMGHAVLAIGRFGRPSFSHHSAANDKIANFTSKLAGADIIIKATAGYGVIANRKENKGLVIAATKSNAADSHNDNQLYLSPNENIGLGTNNPTARLFVTSKTNEIIARFTNNKGGAEIELAGSINGATIKNNKGGKGFEFATYNSSGVLNTKQLYLTPAGNVGIGADPLCKFQIGDMWTFYDGPNDKIIGNNTIWTGSRNERIKQGTASRIYFSATGDVVMQTAAANSAGSAVNDNDWKGIYLKNNGKVGINSYDPVASLEVISKGNSPTQLSVLRLVNDITGDQNSSMTADIDFLLWDSNTRPANVPQARIGIRGTDEQSQDAEAGGNLCFYTAGKNYNNPLIKERMRITQDGNVGIGTSETFNYKLAVNGVVGCKNVIVEVTSAWPDYVFAKDYDLMPLSRVEKFINENRHLPGIPSADQIEKQGIDISDMNAVLLKKIEELTLYTIEQQKLIEELGKTTRMQQEMIEKLNNLINNN